MTTRINHQDIVRKVLESKAIDFSAVGKLYGELAPGLALSDEPWDVFCGTMRTFTRIFILQDPLGGRLEGLAELSGVANDIKG